MTVLKESLNAFIKSSIALISFYLINFLIIFLLINLLSINDYAYYALAFKIYYFLLLISTFGMEPVVIRLILGKKERRETNQTISHCFNWILLFSILIFLFLFFSADLIEFLYDMEGLGTILKFLSIFLFFTNIINFFEIVLRGIGKFTLYVISNVGTNILKLIIILFNFYEPLFIPMIIGLFALISAIQFIIMIIFMQKSYKILSYLSIRNFFSKVYILKSAFIVFLPLLFSFLSQRFNIFILAYTISNYEYAIYDLTLFLIQIISLPIFIFNVIIIPLASKYYQYHEKGKKEINKLYQIIIKIGLFYMIPLTILLYFIADYIIMIFFPLEYLTSAFYVKHYLIYLNITIVGVVGANFLYASDQAKMVLRLLSVTSLTILILSFVLIPIFKTLAAIYAIIVPYSIYLITSVLIVKKKNNIRLKKDFYLFIFKLLVSSILSILTIIIINFIFGLNLSYLIHLALFISLYYLFFLTFSILLRVIRLNQITKIFKVIKDYF